MEALLILEYLASWVLLVFAQSLFINGVYQSATGETKKRVDGSDEDSDMILYWLKKIFEKTKNTHVKYKGDYSRKINLEIWDTCRSQEVIDWDEGSNLLTWRRKNQPISDKVFFERVLKNKFDSVYIELPDKLTIEVYKVYRDYYYPAWIRKPIIQCVKCMSSFWGGVTYWPVVLYLFGFHWMEIPIFFADVFSLTYLNWILYKKAQ